MGKASLSSSALPSLKVEAPIQKKEGDSGKKAKQQQSQLDQLQKTFIDDLLKACSNGSVPTTDDVINTMVAAVDKVQNSEVNSLVGTLQTLCTTTTTTTQSSTNTTDNPSTS
jgi:hypothetical protein